MPAKAPDGMRWCKICVVFLPRSQFGNYLSAYCKPHWLEWNREKSRRHRQEHPEYHAEWRRQWRKDHPDKVKASNQKMIADQRQAGWPAYKRWLGANREYRREYAREQDKRWRAANPEKAAARSHAARSRRLKAPGHHRGWELIEITKRFGGVCLYCQRQATSWDHIYPLVRGGSNFAWNLAPACLGCNCRKNASDVLVFITQATPTDDGKTYIQEALTKSAAIIDPNVYRRRPGEKVSEGDLWDEARKVYKHAGRVTETTLRQAKYNISTFRRRLGSPITSNKC